MRVAPPSDPLEAPLICEARIDGPVLMRVMRGPDFPNRW